MIILSRIYDLRHFDAKKIFHKFRDIIIITALLCLGVITDGIIGANNWVLLSALGLILLFLKQTGKLPKCDNRYTTECITTMVIFLASYYILFYLFGLLTGFYNNLLSQAFWSNHVNKLLLFQQYVYIFLAEVFRYYIVKKYKSKKVLLIVTIAVIAAMDILPMSLKYNFKYISDTIEFFACYFIPLVFCNIAWSYIASKTNFLVVIFYRFVNLSAENFAAIIPSTGIYLKCIIRMILPIILFVVFYRKFGKFKLQSSQENKISKVQNFIIAFINICLLTLIALVSGIFKYYVLAIGSGSMEPIINKGDAVIIRKTSKDEIKNIQIGEVLVYNHAGVTIVHRVKNIVELQGKYYFFTKGDNNASSDTYGVPESDVIGTTQYRIPCIGLPTIWLREQINF